MKILIVGGGGREHALAWKCAQSSLADHIYVAPGNAGTAEEPKVSNAGIAAGDIDGLLEFARGNDIGLTIVGPEGPLVEGIVDRFAEAGLACFGPTAEAARLEGSKSFCKDFLSRHGIPTAAYATFSDPAKAMEYIRGRGAPIVVKADGLAAGKGVVVADSVDQACEAADAMLSGNRHGDAGHRVVVEEYLSGEEASFIVMCDGGHVLPMASSQDHKARDRGDLGPNTGGMGAYSPAPVITGAMHDRILSEVIRPTVDGMAADGAPYKGFLYAGLMITGDGRINVLEYNCRFGDPETQPIIMRLQSDLVDLCARGVQGSLDGAAARWDERVALGMVLASAGYPEPVRKGDVISGLPAGDGAEVKVFHAGTARRDGRLVTAGGRVLCVTALAPDVRQAQRRALETAAGIHWEGMFYRDDIGHRAIARE